MVFSNYVQTKANNIAKVLPKNCAIKYLNNLKPFLREINSLGSICLSKSSVYFIKSLKLKIGLQLNTPHLNS